MIKLRCYITCRNFNCHVMKRCLSRSLSLFLFFFCSCASPPSFIFLLFLALSRGSILLIYSYTLILLRKYKERGHNDVTPEFFVSLTPRERERTLVDKQAWTTTRSRPLFHVARII